MTNPHFNKSSQNSAVRMSACVFAFKPLCTCTWLWIYLEMVTRIKSKAGESNYLYKSLVRILVSSSHCDKIPRTGWLVNNKNVFLIVLEPGNLRSGCQHCWVLMRALFQVVGYVSSHGREKSRSSPSMTLNTRALMPFRRARPYDLIQY